MCELTVVMRITFIMWELRMTLSRMEISTMTRQWIRRGETRPVEKWTFMGIISFTRGFRPRRFTIVTFVRSILSPISAALIYFCKITILDTILIIMTIIFPFHPNICMAPKLIRAGAIICRSLVDPVLAVRNIYCQRTRTHWTPMTSYSNHALSPEIWPGWLRSPKTTMSCIWDLTCTPIDTHNGFTFGWKTQGPRCLIGEKIRPCDPTKQFDSNFSNFRFSIVNLTKPDSLYKEGMRPLMYSTTDATNSMIGWRRCGENVAYYRNEDNSNSYNSKNYHQVLIEDFDDEDHGMCSFTLTFTVEFEHENDTVYFAHSYPYTYSDLQDYLMAIQRHPIKSKFCKLRLLCRSLAGNNVYYLTVTAPSTPEEEQQKVRESTPLIHPLKCSNLAIFFPEEEGCRNHCPRPSWWSALVLDDERIYGLYHRRLVRSQKVATQVYFQIGAHAQSGRRDCGKHQKFVNRKRSE